MKEVAREVHQDVHRSARRAARVHRRDVGLQGYLEVVFVWGDPEVDPIAQAGAQRGDIEPDRRRPLAEIHHVVRGQVDHAVALRLDRRHHVVVALIDGVFVAPAERMRGRRRGTVRAVVGVHQL